MTEAIRSFEKSNLVLNKRRSDLSVDDSEKTSSTLFRIQRKQEDRSHSKRSSRMSFDSAKEALSLSKFYIKMGAANSLQCPQVHRNSKFSTNDVKPVKRRSPTPLPGFRRKDEQKSPRNESTMDVERQVQLAELEKKVQDERIRKIAAERRAQIFQREVREKLKVIKQLEQKLSFQNHRDQQKKGVDRESQESCPIKSSNLQKLRKNMTQFRVTELEQDKAELVRKNNELKMEIDRLKIENQAYRDQTQALKNQIFQLSQKTGQAMLESKQREIEHLRQRINESSSQRETSLDNLLVETERHNLTLKNKITHLEMKIAFINRKKNEEIELITTRKDKDLIAMRKKLTILAKQIVELRKETASHKIRHCAMSSTDPRSRKDSECSLELSPDP